MTAVYDIHARGFAERTADDAAPRGPIDSWLLGAVLLLVVSGEIVVFNTTYFHAAERYGDAYLFVRKHTLALLIGSVACLAAVCLPSTVYRRLAYPALVVAVVGLGLVLLPGIGHGPVRRWLSLGGFNFQPSEFAKWAVIVYLAYALTKKADRLHSFADGLLPPLLVAGGVALLVGVAPDLGSAVYVGVLVLALLFAAGARFRHIAGVLVAGLLLVGVGVLTASYRAARLSTFLNQGADVQGAGYQLHQSLLAFGAGGLSGVGLGEGHQKMFYLPEAHTDFVFAVVGEEAGLWGTTGLLLLFALLGVRGLRVALHHPTRFGRLLAFGCTFMIVSQAGLNMAVAVGLLPTTGLPLPFVSYGGSALVMGLLAVGVLLALSRETPRREVAHA